jgi:hypothetical protein
MDTVGVVVFQLEKGIVYRGWRIQTIGVIVGKKVTRFGVHRKLTSIFDPSLKCVSEW